MSPPKIPSNPTSLDLKTLNAVPGLVIEREIKASEARTSSAMSEAFKAHDAKLETVSTDVAVLKKTGEATEQKVDSLYADLKIFMKEVRDGFERNDKANSLATTERAVLRVQVKAIETKSKVTHRKQDVLLDLFEKITDPKRLSALLIAIGAGWGAITSSFKKLLPWLSNHPNADAALKILGFVSFVVLIFYFLRPVSEKVKLAKIEERLIDEDKSDFVIQPTTEGETNGGPESSN